MSAHDDIRIAVLVSGRGRGTNLQAIIDACESRRITGCVALVVSTNPEAPALERARRRGVPTVVLRRADYGSDEEFDDALLQHLHTHQIDLVCLAGYMRKLSPRVVSQYRWRIMNVHPALIPSFCGQGMYGHHVHEAVLEYGVKLSGVTVHFVDEGYDTGPIILQEAVPVEDDDTPDTLAARILPREHANYTRAIQLFAEGRLKVEGRRVRILPPHEPSSA
ncbi:MAG: phosphoribosylglycinamide formyltransferase [Armatimonadota bacterium]